MKKNYEKKCMEIRRKNQALNMRSLAAAYGYAYGKVREMSLLPGFPMVCGAIIPSDFDRWRDRMAAGTVTETAGRTPRERIDWKKIEESVKKT